MDEIKKAILKGVGEGFNFACIQASEKFAFWQISEQVSHLNCSLVSLVYETISIATWRQTLCIRRCLRFCLQNLPHFKTFHNIVRATQRRRCFVCISQEQVVLVGLQARCVCMCSGIYGLVNVYDLRHESLLGGLENFSLKNNETCSRKFSLTHTQQRASEDTLPKFMHSLNYN